MDYQAHSFEKSLQLGDHFNDQIFETAYGSQGLGMPLKGSAHNVGNLNAYTLQKFQIENIRPDRIVVLGAGVHDHMMFGEGQIYFPPVIEALVAANYTGGVHVELSRHSYDAANAVRKSYDFLKPIIDDALSSRDFR